MLSEERRGLRSIEVVVSVARQRKSSPEVAKVCIIPGVTDSHVVPPSADISNEREVPTGSNAEYVSVAFSMISVVESTSRDVAMVEPPA
jgi:hypothetical protein